MAQTGTAQKRARTKLVRRWRSNMEVQDDAKYVEMLNTLSEGSVRRNFNPYTDIDWKSPEFAVTDNDPRWILPKTDPLGRHSWYQSQPKNVRSRSACGVRPMWPRSACTSSRS